MAGREKSEIFVTVRARVRPEGGAGAGVPQTWQKRAPRGNTAAHQAGLFRGATPSRMARTSASRKASADGKRSDASLEMARMHTSSRPWGTSTPVTTEGAAGASLM